MGRQRNGDDSGAGTGPRTRPKSPPSELDLSREEVRALADEGVDAEELARVEWDRPEHAEASDHDRDTAREDLEALVGEQDEEA